MFYQNCLDPVTMVMGGEVSVPGPGPHSTDLGLSLSLSPGSGHCLVQPAGALWSLTLFCLQRYSLFVNDMQSQIFILARPAASPAGALIGREIAAAVSTNERLDINQALREGGVITYTLANTF